MTAQTPVTLADLSVARRIYGDDYLREVFSLLAAARYARPLARKNCHMNPVEADRILSLVRERGGAITSAITGKYRYTIDRL